MADQVGMTYDEIDAIVASIRAKSSPRKMRLFVCACFRPFWSFVTCQEQFFPEWFRALDRWVPAALLASESYADGAISKKELRAAAQGGDTGSTYGKTGGPHNVAWYMCRSDAEEVLRTLASILAVCNEGKLSFPLRSTIQAIRIDLFHVKDETIQSLDPEWLTWKHGTVPKLAQTIYDDRRFDLLPILADALQEAGCTNADILLHCHSPGPHVRGCWVVDLLLGKA
jgi:hypothetical protein